MILLVDEDAAVEDALRCAELPVIRCSSELALAAARRMAPKVVLVSRWRDLERLRLQQPAATLFFLVDFANVVERIAAFACGARGYIVRDEVEVLVAAVRAAISVRTESEASGGAAGGRLH